MQPTSGEAANRILIGENEQENRMSEDDKSAAKMDDVQMAAVAVSVTIIVFFVVYWAIQIDSVRELLNMAYG